jgi:hypothetical protein
MQFFIHLFLSIHWWKHEARSRVDHVTESLNSESFYSRSFVSISFKESYLFHSFNLEACSSLIEWDRIDIVERWIDTNQSLHLDTDQKTIKQFAKNELWLMIYSFESHRSFLFVMKSEIIFRNFSYIWLRFLSLSIYSRCSAVRKRIEFKRFILLNLVSIKFVSLRSQSTSSIIASSWIFAKSSRSQNRFTSHTTIFLDSTSSELNERNSELRKMSWDENQEMKDIQSYK